MTDNRDVITTAFGSETKKDKVIEHVLIDQLMALVGEDNEVNVDDQVVKMGPLLQMAKIPCETDNDYCE